MRGKYIQFAAGILVGAALFGGGTAMAAGILAEPSTSPIYVDGQQVQITAYTIGGNNYVKLRDIGQAVGFNVYWDGAVQIDSDAPYTGEAPAPAMELDAVRQEIVRLVNEVRCENGASALTVNDSLMSAAQERAETMYTYHRTKEDCEAVIAHGYPYGFGANITAFTGVATEDAAREAVRNWVNSPGHFQTMIDPDGDTIGVGFAEDQYKTVCYLFIGNPKSVNPYE